MFNVGPPELLVILVLALVLVGPEQLPGIIRKSAKTFAEIKKVSTSLRTEFIDTLDAETKELQDAFSSNPLSFPDSGDPKAVSPTFSEEDKEVIASVDAEKEKAVAEEDVADDAAASNASRDDEQASGDIQKEVDSAAPQISESSDGGKETDSVELDQSP